MAAPDGDYAAGFLRANDRDRYLATLMLTGEARGAVTALLAFSADVASVRERAREPQAGEIRLQWWADAIAGEGHGAVAANPLAAALLAAIDRYDLPTGPLLRLIAARRFDLYDDPMPDVASFEGYAGDTHSVLFQFAAMILNGGKPVETGDAAGYLGVAQALVGHMRAFGYAAHTGRIFLPWSVLAANGVREDEVFAGRESEGLDAAFAQFHDMAETHLAQAGAAIAALPADLRPAFALLPVIARQRRRLAERGGPFRSAPETADWRKLGAMLVWLAGRR